MLETLYSTGLRRSELLTLQVTDLDRERELVLVRCRKGRKDRFVPIGQPPPDPDLHGLGRC